MFILIYLSKLKMDSDDLYEINSQIGNNIYPTVNPQTNQYISNYKDATLIDDSILDSKSYAEPYKQIMYKKNIKSHVYNPQTGNYNEVYTSESEPEPVVVKSKWKKLSTIPETTTCENNFCICPVCNTSAVNVCNCVNRDSICKNNHTWHIKNNKRIIGHTHKSNYQPINNNNAGCILM